MSAPGWWSRQAADSWPRVVANTIRLWFKEPLDALDAWGRSPRAGLGRQSGLGPLLCVLVPIMVAYLGFRCLVGLVEPSGLFTRLVGLLAVGCGALGLYVDLVWLRRPVRRSDRPRDGGA